MIAADGKYYLYRHIRLDTNQVFYVGIGVKTKKDIKYNYYTRSTCKWRNSFWNNVIAKTDYEVEIVLESDSKDFIKQKEVEFIALYGRRDKGLGTLVNLTDGGEGNQGYKHTEEAIKKMSELKKGKLSPKKGIKVNPESIRRRAETLKGKEKPSLSVERRKALGEINKKRWEEWRKTHTKQPKSKYYKNYYKKVEQDKRLLNAKPVIQYTINGEFIKEWRSLSYACTELNMDWRNVKMVLDKERKRGKGFGSLAYGYVWKSKL